MQLILPNLWLSSFKDLENIALLKELKITHILSVMDHCPLFLLQNFTHKWINALDVVSQDLLTHFDDTFTFINEGREKGGVIVHCLAGVSRSGTIITAYIMKLQNLDVSCALTFLRQRSDIHPNEGFEAQLCLYQNMGCILHKDYKQYKLYQKLRTNKKYTNFTAASIVSESNLSSLSNQTYKCRRCRHLLFEHTERVYHNNLSLNDVVCNDEIFIHPLPWILSNEMKGKIICPRCSTKIGSFSWIGERCTCFSFIVPAFHIAKQKVDIDKS